MKYIWKLVEHIEEEHRQKTVFLVISACIWGLLAFAVSIPIGLFAEVSDAVIFSLCAAGYGSILVGIYGGIFYLYRNE